jgi:hypothetical protein
MLFLIYLILMGIPLKTYIFHNYIIIIFYLSVKRKIPQREERAA